MPLNTSNVFSCPSCYSWHHRPSETFATNPTYVLVYSFKSRDAPENLSRVLPSVSVCLYDSHCFLHDPRSSLCIARSRRSSLHQPRLRNLVLDERISCRHSVRPLSQDECALVRASTAAHACTFWGWLIQVEAIAILYLPSTHRSFSVVVLVTVILSSRAERGEISRWELLVGSVEYCQLACGFYLCNVYHSCMQPYIEVVQCPAMCLLGPFDTRREENRMTS